MKPLIVAEFQLVRLKLISRDIRRALLVEYTDRLPGHRRFLDTFATALGYRSFSHLSLIAKTQRKSDTVIHHALYSRCNAVAHAVMELLSTQDAFVRDKILETIDMVLEKHGVHEQDATVPPSTPANEKHFTTPTTENSTTVENRCIRVRHRRREVRRMVNTNEFGLREVDVGLKTALHICSKWGLSEQETSELLGHVSEAHRSPDSQTRLLEKFSYVLRIYRLLNDVQQGKIERARSWIKRPMSVFSGATPFELMKEGPASCAEVMEYLQHILGGGS